MDDDRGLRPRRGQKRAGPPRAALPGPRRAPTARELARERTVRELGGAQLTVRPDRARCTGCIVTQVVLDAGPAAAPRLRRRPDRPGPGGRRPRGAGTGSSRATSTVPGGTCAAGSAGPAAPPANCGQQASRPSWCSTLIPCPAGTATSELAYALDARGPRRWPWATGSRAARQRVGAGHGADPGPATDPVPGRLVRQCHSRPLPAR